MLNFASSAEYNILVKPEVKEAKRIRTTMRFCSKLDVPYFPIGCLVSDLCAHFICEHVDSLEIPPMKTSDAVPYNQKQINALEYLSIPVMCAICATIDPECTFVTIIQNKYKQEPTCTITR
mmetsp:Transcript_11178/g.33111  ORF Transcript_11178/g.33111 Transcript_11178/m.33111 type:complete len:121 (+) Transcript_11178:152-514(+)